MSELLQARQIQKVNATRNYIRQTLIDQNMQTWQANLEISTKGLNYKLYKSDINIENDLTLFPQKVYYPIIRFSHYQPQITCRARSVGKRAF